jgi:hypothetical protein
MGFPTDLQGAVHCLKLSADQENDEAQWRAGDCLLEFPKTSIPQPECLSDRLMRSGRVLRSMAGFCRRERVSPSISHLLPSFKFVPRHSNSAGNANPISGAIIGR